MGSTARLPGFDPYFNSVAEPRQPLAPDLSPG